MGTVVMKNRLPLVPSPGRQAGQQARQAGGENSQGVGTVVMKNWLPFVPGPALAMDRVKGRSCRRFLQGSQAGRQSGQGRQGSKGDQ